MKRVAVAAPQEREAVFLAAAEKRVLSAALVEKDFWVCWTLARLFALPEIAPHLLFKGGTTLSKVYNAIERFSEDIDISIDRAFLRPGAGDAAEVAELSKTRQKKEIEALVAAFYQAVEAKMLPALHALIASELGLSEWTLERDAVDAGTLLFTYPTGVQESEAYVRPVVRIEFGGRSDVWPSQEALVTPYASEDIPQAFEDAHVPVRVLSAERTFWEKATLLHNEYYRPATKRRGDRISRHYYDLSRLAAHPHIGPSSLAERSLLERVVAHKSLYYRDTWSQYDAALSGEMHLLPPVEARSDLQADYGRMRAMFFTAPPKFETIWDALALLETQINRS